MKISGSNVVAQPVDKVWDAILDPRVLVPRSPAASAWRRPATTSTP